MLYKGLPQKSVKEGLTVQSLRLCHSFWLYQYAYPICSGSGGTKPQNSRTSWGGEGRRRPLHSKSGDVRKGDSHDVEDDAGLNGGVSSSKVKLVPTSKSVWHNEDCSWGSDSGRLKKRDHSLLTSTPSSVMFIGYIFMTSANNVSPGGMRMWGLPGRSPGGSYICDAFHSACAGVTYPRWKRPVVGRNCLVKN